MADPIVLEHEPRSVDVSTPAPTPSQDSELERYRAEKQRIRALTEPPVKSPAKETPPPPQAPTPPATPPPPEEPDDEPDEPPAGTPAAKVSRRQQRINDQIQLAVAQAVAAERARLLDQMRQGTPAEPPAPQEFPPTFSPTRPEPSESEVGTTYATHADYVKDLARWTFDQQVAVRQHQEREAVHRQFWQNAANNFQAQTTAALRAHPDLDERLTAVSHIGFQRFDPAILHPAEEAIYLSPVSGELRYYLATHEDEYARIVKLAPKEAEKAIWRIEQSLNPEPAHNGNGSATPPVTRTTPPVQPLAGSPVASRPDPSTMTLADWKRQPLSMTARRQQGRQK